MAIIDRLCVGESQVGDGMEVAHIDLILGPRGSPAETAFAQCLVNEKEGFSSVLALLAPNLMCKPATVIFNKVSLRHPAQSVNLFGPAQRAVALAVTDSVAEGVLPADEAQDLFLCVGVFIHWHARDEKRLHDHNYRATREAIARAVSHLPTVAETLQKKALSET